MNLYEDKLFLSTLCKAIDESACAWIFLLLISNLPKSMIRLESNYFEFIDQFSTLDFLFEK